MRRVHQRHGLLDELRFSLLDLVVGGKLLLSLSILPATTGTLAYLLAAVAGFTQLCSPWGTSFIGTIRPFVQGQAIPVTKRLRVTGAFALGFLCASSLLLIITKSLGVGLQVADLPVAARLTVGGLVCLVLVAVDAFSIRHRSMCVWSLPRQVPKQTMYRFHRELTALAWGWDNGLIVTTFRVSAVSWAVITLTFIGLSGWIVGLIYGLAFLMPLWLAFWLPGSGKDRGSDDAGRVAWVVAHQLRFAQSAAMATMALVGVALVVAGLGQWL